MPISELTLFLLLLATWSAAQTEGQDDSERERESAVPEPGENTNGHFVFGEMKELTTAPWQRVSVYRWRILNRFITNTLSLPLC